MLRQRLITGSLLIALLAGVVWLDVTTQSPNGLLLTIVTACFAFVGGVEMTRLVDAGSGLNTKAPFPMAGGLGAAAMTVVTWMALTDSSTPEGLLVVVPMGAVVLSLIATACSRGCEHAVKRASGAALASVWVGGGLGILLGGYGEVGWQLLLVVVALTKIADTGAYFTGRLIGHHKLIPWVSPGKTWEGLAGGVVSAMLASIVYFEYIAVQSPSMADDHVTRLLLAATPGLVLAIGGLFGDLAISMLKRDAGVKDSGSLLPGMGGVLDVLDSLLVAGPLLWLVASLVQ
jgi:phosphatidate cytidylyltransferase